MFIGSDFFNDIKVDENDFKGQFSKMAVDIEQWKLDMKSKIEDLVKKNGPLRAKAFPGRAAILIKLLNLNESHLSVVYEIKGSIKVGHYVPGTRITIEPESNLYSLEDQSQPILNLAWHLPQEVRENLKNNGYQGEVIDLKELKE